MCQIHQIANVNILEGHQAPLLATKTETEAVTETDTENENRRMTRLGSFIGYEHKRQTVVPPKMSEKVLHYAQKRLQRSLSDETDASSSSFSTLQAQHDVVNVEHGQIELGYMLGQGSFSSVFEIKSIRGNESEDINKDQCVVKVLKPKLLLNPAMLSACAADLAKEGLIMASLRHGNILSVKAWTPSGLDGYRSGRHDAFFLVLDKLDYTLDTKLWLWAKRANKLKYKFINRGTKKADFLHQRLQVALQLANAIKYLHSQNILHRDLKPENIGFVDGVLKVFDFDVARKMPSTNSRRSSDDETFLLSKRVGSPRYMSPECALGEKYNLKADVYTFGLLLHQILSLEKPYTEIQPCDHDYYVFHRGCRPKIPSSWNSGIQRLLAKSWSTDIQKRPRMSEIHSFLAKRIPEIVAEKKSSATLRRRSVFPSNTCVRQ